MPHEDATKFSVAIIIPSDRAHSGERADATGPALAEALGAISAEVISVTVVPDDRAEIAAKITEAADSKEVDVILVAGGTGLGPRDVTPEATMDVIDRVAPGIAELIRARSLEITSRACLSRAIAGVRGTTLVINLPGSPKAATESLGFVAEVLPHAVSMLRGGGH
jgi:molybdopterin adenylyltransferase